MTYVILVIGLLLLLVGANYLVDSSVAIAKRAKMSNFLIGLTIVGIGTSAPELYVSLTAAVKGLGDISLGNVVGSNICNILLILGVTAIVTPFSIERMTLKRDIPFNIFISILLLLICSDTLYSSTANNQISRFDGIGLMVIFALYMWYTVKAKDDVEEEYEETATSSLSKCSIWVLIPIVMGSLGALIYGGNLFLDSAITLAREIGVSESVISITLVAVGTSLPELITSIIAATKGNAQLALGNVLGSNIFNLLLILGLSATIAPIQITNINMMDFIVLIIASVLTFIAAFTMRKKIVDRSEGIIFILLYVMYSVYLVMR